MGKTNKGKKKSGEKEKKALADLLAAGELSGEWEAGSSSSYAGWEKEMMAAQAILSSTLNTQPIAGADPTWENKVVSPTRVGASPSSSKATINPKDEPIIPASSSSKFAPKTSVTTTPSSVKPGRNKIQPATLKPPSLANTNISKPTSSKRPSNPVGTTLSEPNPSNPGVILKPLSDSELFREVLGFMGDIVKGENVASRIAEKILEIYGPQVPKEAVNDLVKHIQNGISDKSTASQVAHELVQKLMDSGHEFIRAETGSGSSTFVRLADTNKARRVAAAAPIPSISEISGMRAGKLNASTTSARLEPGEFPSGVFDPKFAESYPDKNPTFDLIDKAEKEAISADWSGNWPFLIQTLLNDAYLDGKQVLIWTEDNKMAWGTLDEDQEALFPELATMKMVMPKDHCHEDEPHAGFDGVCKVCLEEMDARDLEDFTPALGFPSIKRPIGHSIKLKKLKGKYKGKGTRKVDAKRPTLDDVLEKDEKDGNAESNILGETLPDPNKDKPKRTKKEIANQERLDEAQEQESVVTQTESGQYSGLVFNDVDLTFDPKTGEITPTVDPKTIEQIKAFEQAAKLLSKHIERFQKESEESNQQGFGYIVPNWKKPEITSTKVSNERASCSTTGEGLKNTLGAQSPKPKKHSGSEHYDKLRNQRAALALGIGRFVIDSIKEGKKPVFDVSMDGRIELGHMGDTFPMKQSKLKHGKVFLGETLDTKTEVKLVTAPVVRISEKKNIEGSGATTTFRFPQAVSWHDLFKVVEMESDGDPKGKQKMKQNNGDDPKEKADKVSFGSSKYRIIPGQEKVYGDIDKLAENFVQGIDIAEEAWHWVMKRGREIAIRDAMMDDPIASASMQTNAEKDIATKEKEYWDKSIPSCLTDSLSYHKEELLKLMKELPPGHKAEKMGFDGHLKEMDRCLKGIETNFDFVRTLIRDTLRDFPPPASQPNISQPSTSEKPNSKGKGKSK